MHRPTLGVVALVLVSVGAVLFSTFSVGNGAVLMRAGCLCAVLWLAHPQLERVPKSVWIGMLILVVVLARVPKLLPVFLVVLIVIAILKPRTARGEKKERQGP